MCSGSDAFCMLAEVGVQLADHRPLHSLLYILLPSGGRIDEWPDGMMYRIRPTLGDTRAECEQLAAIPIF